MAITLSDGVTPIVLPEGLLWEDEDRWDPVAQSAEYTLTGALVVEEANRLAGRPITLAGGERWAWMTRAALASLRSLGAEAGTTLTLTLHDARVFSVTPRRDGANGAWLDVEQLPVVGDSGLADPASTTRYSVEKIRLMEI